MSYRCIEGTWHRTDEVDTLSQYCETPFCWHNGAWRQSLPKKRQQQCDECRREELRKWLKQHGSSDTI